MALTWKDVIEILNDKEKQEKIPALKSAYKAAISSSEKQMPKTPKIIHMIDDKRGRFRCSCGYIITHNFYLLDDVCYCQKCGQKIRCGVTLETEG